MSSANAQRAGAHVLATASDRFNREMLRELLRRPLDWSEGRQMEITPAGREMNFVGAIGEAWARKAPGGLDPDSERAEAALAALLDGWSATIVHRLAVAPLTLTGLGLALDTMSREDVTANVAAMREVGLLEARPQDGEGATYVVTDWLRHAVAPLLAATRCERHYSARSSPLAQLDVEATFLLALPLLRLPGGLAGRCRLVVEPPENEERPAAGVTTRVEDRRLASCKCDLEGSAEAWAIGTENAWLEAIIEGMAEDLELGGEERLARELVEALHRCLFRAS